MLSPDWLLTWWSIFGQCGGRQLRIIALRWGSRLVGVAPLLTRRHWYRSAIPLRRLEALGCGEPEGDGICSDYLNVIAEVGQEEAIAGKLARVIHSGKCGPWDELVLPMLNGESRMPGILEDAFRSLGLLTEIRSMGQAPYITLPGSWDAFLGKLKKKHRYSVLRTQREFEEWAKSDVSVRVAESQDELKRGLAILQSLHAERWREDGGGGRFRVPRFAAFHHAVMPHLLRKGALELVWLSVRGQPVAAQYNIVWNRKVYFYQCGRAMNLPENIRAGQVLLLHSIRRAIESGHREFDFLNGAAAYKMQLATAVRPLVGLRVARPCMAECIHQWTERRIDQLKRFRSKWRGFRRANQQ